MRQFLNRFATDEDGGPSIEYGLILVFIALAIVATLPLVGIQLDAIFASIAPYLAV